MERGKYIVIEGGDGTGKTTQVKRLVSRLQESNINAVEIREPGGDPMGERIRELLLDPTLERVPATEVYLFNAARIQTLGRIATLQAMGIWAVADRSRVSTTAYQGYGHKLDIDFVRTVCDLAVQGHEPDLSLILYAPHAVTIARRDSRATKDRFERMNESFHERVNRGYVQEARRLGLPVIAADDSEDAVEAAIWSHIEPLIESRYVGDLENE